MTNSTAPERVSSVLAAVVAGTGSPPTVAGARDAVTDAGSVNAAQVRNEEKARNEDRARNEDQTQIRVFPTAPAVEFRTGSSDTDAIMPIAPDVEPSDTESEWIEPDPSSTGKGAAVGTLLGNRYLLEYKLGEGGMGVVFRATDVEVKGETFAVKVLKPAIQKRPEALKLVREEVRKTRGLRHPNIVGVYSLNSDPTGAYMLMEFLEGKSVSALIDEEFGRGMPLMRAWPLINDIGSALAYAHDHNVIHSDLKPSNLFVTVSGKAMLLDFGIARAVRVRSDRFDTGSLGALTPAYASCEMLNGSAPDQSDDVYAFACVIYEMLSGKHPFNSLGAVDAQRIGMRAAPLACLTNRQNQALMRALAFERAQRTASVEALLGGLKGPGRPPQRSQIWLGAGTAACLVAIAVAWFVWRGGPSSEHAPATASQAAGSAAPAASTGTVTPPGPAAVKKESGPLVPSSEPVPLKDHNPAVASAAKPARGTRDAAAGATTAIGAATAPAAAASTPVAASPQVSPSAPATVSVGGKTGAASPPAAKVAASKTAAAGAPVAAQQGEAPSVAAPPDSNAGATPAPVAVAAAAPAAALDVSSSSVSEGAAAAPIDSPAATGSAAVVTHAVASEPAALPTPVSAQSLPTAHQEIGIGGVPPIGKKVPAIIPSADAAEKLATCPYPDDARRQMETGTVVLLVYVSQTGAAADTQVDTSSGSPSLDQAAVNCVKEFGQFTPRVAGKRGAGYWGRMKFNWSFGG